MKIMKPARSKKHARLIMNPAHGLMRHSVSHTTITIIPVNSRAVGFFIMAGFPVSVEFVLMSIYLFCCLFNKTFVPAFCMCVRFYVYAFYHGSEVVWFGASLAVGAVAWQLLLLSSDF